MRYGKTPQLQWHSIIECTAILGAIFLVSSVCAAQTAPASEPPKVEWFQKLQKNPELMAELNKLSERLQHGLQYPPARSVSRLLPLMPESTFAYSAIPNYGDMVHQALNIFREELKESSVLRDWWQHGDMATIGPKVEDGLEKIYRLAEYLGDEIVISGDKEIRNPGVLFVAEVRKPGLDNYLQQMLKEIAGESKPHVRILRPQDLATAEERRPPEELIVLVRPDFVAGAPDVATLRSFSAQVEKGDREFASSPFGQRVRQAYEGGATGLGAVDLHRILSQMPPTTERNQMIFQSTGFADMKYLVWGLKKEAGQAASQSELSFMGPRHGIASWLAAPGPLASLDYLSPKAMAAWAAQLKDPAKMFEDVKEIAAASGPDALGALSIWEQSLNLSLKDDLFSQLGGEIAFELDDITPQNALWTAILRVNDSGHLQQTLTTLLAAGHVGAEQSKDEGITYYTVRIPSAKKTTEITYAYVGGYMIVASSHERVAQAIRVHQSGESLGKSKKFLAALPAGHPSGASSVLYEDPIAMTTRILRQVAPEMAGTFEQIAGKMPALVVCAYGEETAIRGAGTNAGFDAGVILVVAAIAIPNLLRSRMAANEASAVGGVRTVNTAEITYSYTYPERGFAPDLATLGPDPSTTAAYSADHASLLDATLAAASCTAGTWCTKSGYRFTIAAVCKERLCDEYVVVATPVSNDTGTRSFCSSSDGVIRFQTGVPLTSPVSAAECATWAPLQ
jgi:type IV pilus assembly protein PilA